MKGKIMKKKISLIIILGLLVLSGCKPGTSGDISDSTPPDTSLPDSTTSEPGERIVRTYVDWSFDGLAIGDDIPNTASEGAGFAAFRKDENNEVWVRSKNPQDWAAIYFGTPDPVEGGEIFLKDFAITSEVMLPSATASDGLSNDGGFPILVGPVGRYDAAMAFNEEGSSINLWHAGNTDGGPIATTQVNEAWGDRGSKATIVNLYKDVKYTITIAGKYQGQTEEGDEFFTLFAFINDRLVIEKKDIAYWTGGFGIRGWQSAIEYNYIKVTDFPLVCPDGIDHYAGETGGEYEPTQLATPVATLIDKTLSWAAIENAHAYAVYNGTAKLFETDLLTADLSTLPAGEYALRVQALSNQNRFIHSELSEAIAYSVAGEVAVTTYLNWTFSDLAAGADMPFVANDPLGFHVVETAGKKWVQSKQKAGWNAVFFGVSDGTGEVFPTNASYSLIINNPNNEPAEGGVCMMVGGAGRYDVALYINGASSSINVWEAGNTDNGPAATTQNNPLWGDRGSQVESLTLENLVDIKFEVIYKEDPVVAGKFTIYVFVDNVLVIKQAGLTAKSGGFGLRSLDGELLNTNLLITSAPSMGPDGVTAIV